MIRNLTINNIALIDHIEIDFDEGLTTLSGETGSGKSIIIDSLSFVLGERADKNLIKFGADFAEVSALFEVDDGCSVLDKLQEYGYSNDNEILISRKMTIAGKNEIRIQGKTSTLAILRDICSELVDIFGQGEHLALLDEKKQLSVLDSFCDFGNIVDDLTSCKTTLKDVNKQINELGGSDENRENTLDFLKYQIEEIEKAALDLNEEDELIAKRKRMMNAEKIAESFGIALNNISGENGASVFLTQARDCLRNVSNVEDQAENLSERINSVLLELNDVSDSVQNVLDSLEFSPVEADKVEERLDLIKNLKRKYGGSVEAVLDFCDNAKEKYDRLCNSAELLLQLNSQKNEILEKMYCLAKQKSVIRKNVANILSNKIMKELCDLGMKNTIFCVEFNDEPTLEQYKNSSDANGFDIVRFLMSANVGEPLKPLSKVISGGEMSRFMLAVKNITAQAEKIPTMVFDEIDTGISGKMAQQVAEKIANVSSPKKGGYQCIVITHLPQIVAMGDNGLFIEKIVSEGKTHTEVCSLTDNKVVEVARLMGSVGEHGTENAQELIDYCQNYKNSIC